MWRIWRGFRSKATLPSARIAAQLAGSRPVVLQHVKFKRPRINARQVVFGGIVFFVCTSVYIHVVIDPWDRFVRAHLATLSKEELLELKKKMEEPSFWPVPLTLHTVDSPPYRGSDPEWEMFLKINKDTELTKKIRNDLATRVQRTVAAHPYFSSQQPWKVRHWWLHVDYPRAPPPVYYRHGLEITNEDYTWTTKEVDRTLAIRLQRTLWPEPLAMSLFTLTTSLFKQNALQIAARFGYRPGEEKGPSSQQPQTSEVKGIPDKAQQASPKGADTVKKEAGAMATTSQRTAGDPPAAASSATSPQSSGESAGSGKSASAQPSTTGKDTRDITATDLVPHDATKSHLKDSMKKGLAKYRQKWRPYITHPPKGSIMVSGLVELESAKQFVIIDVRAWWDPKENQFDSFSMTMGLRKTQVKQQYPAK